jgi:hypothetical protein
MDKIRPPEKISDEWIIGYDYEMPVLCPYSLPPNYIVPDLDDLLSRLKDPDYLNYKFKDYWFKERVCYLRVLSFRNDLTETHKRLIKMYQSKL